MTTLIQSTRESAWAAPVPRLSTQGVGRGALDANVNGKQLAGPVKGFGQLWRKTYRIAFGGPAAPREVLQEWKLRFGSFWPRGNRFFLSSGRIAPGNVAVLNLGSPVEGVALISTGIMVIYADDEQFSFMTPEGHIFAGMITFSCERDEEGRTIAQIEALVRANDPLYEVAFRLGGGRLEDAFWIQTLRNVAAHFGACGRVHCQALCVDPGFQWSEIGNLRHNAALRTPLHVLARVLRWLRRA